MNKREQVEQAIREACPELQELKFGCLFRHEGLRDFKGMFLGLVTANVYYTWRFGDEESGVVPNNLILEKDEITEVIGSPIHLEDVVRAMFIKNKSEHELTKRVQFVELFTLYSLAKTYDQQSDELINFLHPILCGKE